MNKNEDKELNSIDAERLTKAYKDLLDIDISRIIGTTKTIKLRKSNSSGHLYFDPKHISGDSEFYSKLEQYSWYYQKNKWEFNIAKKHIDKGHLLEIGCGYGWFIEQISTNANIIAEGSEFNKTAIKTCCERNLNVSDKKLSEYKSNFFDHVVSFQVLEHIADTSSFFEECHRILKINGKLIIGVPNSKSLVFRPLSDNYYSDGSLLLNLPPHHMNWWDKKSLSKIGKIHNFKIQYCYKEPFSESRRSLMNRNLRIIIGHNIIFKLFRAIMSKIYPYIFKGETLLVVFKKK